MSSGRAEKAVGGEDPSAPSARAMQWVKNRNNIIDMYLKKQIDQFEREKDLHISLLDQDRLDIHDFLKGLKKCDSDNLPEARHWLGERTSSGRRVQRTPRNIATAPAPVKVEEDTRDTRTAPERRNDKEKDELNRYDFQFRSRPQPELVQRTQTLCNIFNRRNVLAGLAQRAWEDDSQAREDQSDPRASVTFKDGRQAGSRASSRGADSAFECGRASADGRPFDHGEYYRAMSANDGAPAKTGDFMKDLLVCKFRKKKRKRKPLEERIREFYDTCENLKQKELEAAANPPDWEAQRKWTLLTKGVKAALAESSDEEEDLNNMHTI